MAKLLLISERTHNSDVNAVRDIVGVFNDDHSFSAHEQTVFKIVDVPNLTADEFLSTLKFPSIQTVIDSDGVEHKMWRNSDSDPWQKLNKPVKYTWTAAGLTPEQETIFLSADVPKETKLSLLAQFGNNTSYQSENRSTVIDITISERPA